MFALLFLFCTATHLVAVLPRIDDRQEDDFFRSASESDSFSSGEDEVPAPDLREVKKKSKNKADSRKEKPPISSKRVSKPPEPVTEPEIQEEHFVAVKAESLFDINEDEEGEEENPEGQDENERFFQPEDKNDDSEDEEAKTDSKKQAKRQRGGRDENASESEEDENENKGITKTKAVTTAVSTFLNHKEPGKESKQEAARQEAGPENQRIGNEEMEEKEEQGDGDDEKEEEESEEDEDESEEDEDEEEDDKRDKEGENEDEEEPRVEFTGDAKPEVRCNVSFKTLIIFFVNTFVEN